jgi:pyrroline-5-carboxylate reductase
VTLSADPVDADAVVLAVKPSDLEEACRGLSEHRYGRVLSIVAGATTASIEKLLWPGAVVIRAMPNTPALLGAGASAISPGAWAGAEDLDWAEAVLSSIGTVVRVPESQLDAVTGLSGSGPAYVFLVAEALIEAAAAVGLPGEVAEGLVVQTLLGSARMLAESGRSPAELREAVTSPGGTTAAALAVFERAGLKAIFLEAVLAATERSRALGKSD